MDELSGEVTLATTAAGTGLLEFELASAEAVDIAIKLDRSGLVSAGFHKADSVGVISSDAATLRLRSQGERQFTVILRPDTTAAITGPGIGREFQGSKRAFSRAS